MKIIIRIALVIMLLAVGFAAGFPLGHSRGFTTGCEWAFVQASLIARERGLFMPVNFVEGHFRIILKQPRDLYQRTRLLAEKYGPDVLHENNREENLIRGASLTQSTNLTR
jgi:hypothetical protein